MIVKNLNLFESGKLHQESFQLEGDIVRCVYRRLLDLVDTHIVKNIKESANSSYCSSSSEIYHKQMGEEAKKVFLKELCALMEDAIPQLDLKLRKLFEFQYSLLQIIVFSLEYAPLRALEEWSSKMKSVLGCKMSSFTGFSTLKQLIIMNDIDDYQTLIKLCDLKNDHFSLFTGQYESMLETSQGIIKLILLIMTQKNLDEGFECIGKNICTLDWKIALSYFERTSKYDFFFDWIARTNHLTLSDMNYLYERRCNSIESDFINNYAERLIRAKSYEKLLVLCLNHDCDFLNEEIIHFCLKNSLAVEGETENEKLKFLSLAKKLDNKLANVDEICKIFEFIENLSDKTRFLDCIFRKIATMDVISNEILIICLKNIEYLEMEKSKQLRSVLFKLNMKR